MSQKVGVDFMKAYLNKLSLPDEPDELLIEAYKRVGGHPYFMSRLIILSVTLPIRELVNSLPQLKDEAHRYIQEQVSGQLDEDARKLLQYLSVIRKPFLLSAIDHLVENTTTKFDQLTKRFLVTKVRKSSSYYEIHDLVKEFELSHLTSDDFVAAHANAANYYINLETRTYSDGVELIGHLIEAENYNAARSTLNTLLGSAMHDGLFDFVIDFSNQLIEDDVIKNWGEIYFFRGRTFRLKGRLSNSLENYRIASNLTQDNFLRESAQLEISSVLVQFDEKKNSREALEILNKLANSENAKIKIPALTSLGYIDIRSKKTLKNGVEQLKAALKLAEGENLHRNIMQICHGLGEAYLKRNQIKNALIYLERARSMRESVREEYGEQDIEGDYHLFYLLEEAYHRSGRYDDAINAISLCAFIDKKLNFQDRLASSLFQLGVNMCLIRKYEDAQQNLAESLRLIRNQKLGSKAEASTIEWLIKSF
jgi:tetratricopeptide (TPR) repeat protein